METHVIDTTLLKGLGELACNMVCQCGHLKFFLIQLTKVPKSESKLSAPSTLKFKTTFCSQDTAHLKTSCQW